MKRTTIFFSVTLFAFSLLILDQVAFAQNNFPTNQSRDKLDQKISISAENENLSDFILKLCQKEQLTPPSHFELLRNKKISINISDKSLRTLFEKLLEDYFLSFSIRHDSLHVQNHISLEDVRFYDPNGNFIAPNTGFLLNKHYPKSRITLKFKLASNLIVIPIQINNSDTLNFIFDTGIHFPIVTEFPYMRKLDLNYLKSYEIKGWGLDRPIKAYHSAGNVITTTGLIARNQDIQFIPHENLQLSYILGIPIYGLIGGSLFQNFIVTINYSENKIILTPPEKFHLKIGRHDIKLPIEIINTRPYIRMTVTTNKSNEVPVKLLLDTGASDAMFLIAESDKRLIIPQKAIHNLLGNGLTGELYGRKGRYESINIGNLKIKNPIIAFPDSAYAIPIIEANDRNGTLGAEILRRFEVTLDYPDSLLILRPNRHLNDPFNYSMSGIEVSNPMPGYPIFVISNIRKNSPAMEAGLKEGDQIVRINSFSNKELSIDQINLLLQMKENKTIHISIIRNSKRIQTSFKLRKEL